MLNSFQILPQPDNITAAAAAGEELNNLLVENKNKPVLLMLSGGSALTILEYVSPSSLGENLTVSMLDDRFSQEAGVNNFLQLQKLDFYKDALDNGASFFGTLPRPNETSAELGKRWENNLRAWRQEHPQGVIVATLGMGPDGHTAGIFPYPENQNKFDQLFLGSAWTVAYDALGKHKFSQRLTATVEFFKHIDFGVAYVCGQDKAAKLKELVKEKNLTNELPARAWEKIKQVKIFTDIGLENKT